MIFSMFLAIGDLQKCLKWNFRTVDAESSLLKYYFYFLWRCRDFNPYSLRGDFRMGFFGDSQSLSRKSGDAYPWDFSRITVIRIFIPGIFGEWDFFVG